MFWSPAFNPVEDLPSLTGKVIIVTGANCSIGFSTVKHLARKGAKVYLGARSEEKGKAAVARLQKEGVGSGEVVWFSCDLGTPVSAKASADAFLQLEDRLDVLVNNAACTFDSKDKPAQDGFTEMMMVNHVGTFQFTKTLLPLLIGTSMEPKSDVRIITVASAGHGMSRATNPEIRFNNLDEFKNFYANDSMSFFPRYAVSKLANILFSNRLQRDLASTPIVCISVHPGTVNSAFHTRVSFGRLTHLLTWLFFKHPDEGALTSVFAAASPLVNETPEKYKGAYLVPVGKITQAAENARKVHLQDELWETTEKYLDSLNI
ncbi:hypothetical protein B0H34DRAFT_732947 [Crassisporium funariophilum]|nr:hypothetical protein B0H34DRAFT_732947 [Crassisporium funariophilum]